MLNMNEMQKVACCINLTSEKHKICGKIFAQEVFSILHSSHADEKKFSSFFILRLPPFKESVPHPRSLKIENGKKEV